MNPALLIVILLAGSALLIGGVLAAVLGWLSLPVGIGLAVIGGLVETAAMVAFIRERMQARQLGR
jgi:hypothetical protein